MTESFDVVILGGGISGLSLAQQLTLELKGDDGSSPSIVVLESASFPAPVASHKVGESTVEIGAHYLADTLQLREHLDTHHLKKFGLRCFFGGTDDLSEADELGPSQSLPVPTYQIDRGILENHLVDVLRKAGVTIYDDCRVLRTDFDDDGSGSVQFLRQGTEAVARGRWVVDASGRRGLFRRQMGLKQRNELNGNATWFRVNKRIQVDDWSSSQDWHNRIACGQRWYSTNHLMGHGYWVWIIPLGSGATSVGIVSSAEHHKITDFTNFDRTLSWLGKHQPRCADALAGETPMDHLWLRDYSYGCSEVFSRQPDKQRWAMTGEAGLFLDPFYSPGMDFIAYSNTFITDLIHRDMRGENIRARQLIYQGTYQTLYESSLRLYLNQYEAFGNFRLMSLKTIWDYAYYWAVLGLLYFNKSITDIDLLKSRAAQLGSVREKHANLQNLFYRSALKEPVVKPTGAFTDHFSIPLLHRLNSELTEELSGDALGRRFDENLVCLEELAGEIEMILQTGLDKTDHTYLETLSRQWSGSPLMSAC